MKYIYKRKNISQRLDEIRSNSNITDWNYMPTHFNASDVWCTWPIDFIDLKDKNDYLNGPLFLHAKETNEYIGAGRIYDDPEIIYQLKKFISQKLKQQMIQENQL